MIKKAVLEGLLDYAKKNPYRTAGMGLGVGSLAAMLAKQPELAMLLGALGAGSYGYGAMGRGDVEAGGSGMGGLAEALAREAETSGAPAATPTVAPAARETNSSGIDGLLTALGIGGATTAAAAAPGVYGAGKALRSNLLQQQGLYGVIKANPSAETYARKGIALVRQKLGPEMRGGAAQAYKTLGSKAVQGYQSAAQGARNKYQSAAGLIKKLFGRG